MRLCRESHWTFYRQVRPFVKSIRGRLVQGTATDQGGFSIEPSPHRIAAVLLSANFHRTKTNRSVFGINDQLSIRRLSYRFGLPCLSYTTPHSQATYTTTSVKDSPTRTTSSVRRFRLPFRSFSTNSTSVSPPPTPSTQGHCLPSTHTNSQEDIAIPEPPNNCCMSGCANCVWITYAQELAQIYKDSGRAADRVMNAIDDPSLKVFLNLELKDQLGSDEDSEDH